MGIVNDKIQNTVYATTSSLKMMRVKGMMYFMENVANMEYIKDGSVKYNFMIMEPIPQSHDFSGIVVVWNEKCNSQRGRYMFDIEKSNKYEMFQMCIIDTETGDMVYSVFLDYSKTQEFLFEYCDYVKDPHSITF